MDRSLFFELIVTLITALASLVVSLLDSFFEVLELFVLDNTLSEVEGVIKEIFRGRGLKPRSACNEASEQSTEYCQAQCKCYSCKLEACLDTSGSALFKNVCILLPEVTLSS